MKIRDGNPSKKLADFGLRISDVMDYFTNLLEDTVFFPSEIFFQVHTNKVK